MKRRSVNHLLLTLGLLILLSACSPPAADSTTEPGGRLQAVATHSILGDLVQNVAGNAIDLEVLVGPDSDAHTYEPPPADLVILSRAGLIFENGLGFEPWMDTVYTSSGSDARRIVVTENIEPLTFEEQGEFDPHVWHDVASAISMIGVIRDALIGADPANAESYRANADAYVAELEALDAWVREQVATLPTERRKLVTNHDTFGYFARAYDFDVIGTALGGSTEGSEPSAGELAALIREVRDAHIPVIFVENVANTDVMNQIAEEAGVSIGPPLYTDALGAPGTDGETYLGLIRYNVEAIVRSLQD